MNYRNKIILLVLLCFVNFTLFAQVDKDNNRYKDFKVEKGSFVIENKNIEYIMHYKYSGGRHYEVIIQLNWINNKGIQTSCKILDEMVDAIPTITNQEKSIYMKLSYYDQEKDDYWDEYRIYEFSDEPEVLLE